MLQRTSENSGGPVKKVARRHFEDSILNHEEILKSICRFLTLAQLYYIQNISPRATPIITKFINAKRQCQSLFDYMIEDCTYKTVHCCYALMSSEVIFGQICWQLHASCMDGEQSQFILIFKNGYNYKLCLVKRGIGQLSWGIQTSSNNFECLLEGSVPHAFVGRDLFMLGRTIIWLPTLTAICTIDHEGFLITRIIGTEICIDNRVICLDEGTMCLKCFLLEPEISNHDQSVSNFIVHNLSEVKINHIFPTFQNPYLCWFCPGTSRVMLISRIGNGGGFFYFAMNLHGNDMVCKYEKDFRKHINQNLDFLLYSNTANKKSQFNVVAQPYLVRSLGFRAVFVVHFYHASVIQICVVTPVVIDNEWSHTLTFVNIYQCSKFFNFFEGNKGELLVKVLQDGLLCLKIFQVGPDLPNDTFELSLKGTVDLTDHPQIYQCFPLFDQYQYQYPFVGPLSGKCYDQLDRGIIPLNEDDEEFGSSIKDCDREKYHSSLYCFSKFTEYESNWSELYLLRCDSGNKREFSHHISEFSHTRYLSLHCEQQEWKPVLVKPLDFYPQENIPKTIFVCLSHKADGGWTFKCQIKALPRLPKIIT